MTAGGRRPHHEQVITAQATEQPGAAAPHVAAGPDHREPITRRTLLAWAICAVAILESATAFVLGPSVGFGFHDMVDNYVLTNGAMAATFPICGALIAANRPRNPIGWLFLGMAVFHGTSAIAVPIDYALAGSASQGTIDNIYAIYLSSWGWGIGTCLFLALQLFPNGRLVARRWRWAAGFTALQGVAFSALMATDTTSLTLRNGVTAHNPLRWAAFQHATAATTIINLATATALVLAIASLIFRYRRGTETERQQLLWLVLALVAIAVLNTQRWITGNGPILLLLSLPLVPIAVTVAILRYRLLDIRVIVNRALVYATLSILVAAAYVGVVALFGTSVGDSPGVTGGLAAALLVALAFNPIRLRVQRLVDRAVYGERHDPVRAISRLGAHLATGDDALVEVVSAVRETLRLPFAALRADGIELAASGSAPEILNAIPLQYADERIGELVVGARSGEARLSSADRRVLDALANPITLALRATAMSEEVQRSRERIVAAREEERRRLRRDLHDGLGPQLTGVIYKADAAGNLLSSSPDEAGKLVAQLRVDTKEALDDVRRLVYGLRPPALDEFGLVGALRRQTETLRRNDGGLVVVSVYAPTVMPDLPAAVEVAAYRIASEALTNIARHSTASRADVRLSVDHALHVEISDNGASAHELWESGVGMITMRERADEVGGSCTAGPTPGGGRVAAELPLALR